MQVASSIEEAGASKPNGHGDMTIAPVPRISLQAFCESAEIAAIIREAVDDRRMDKAHVKVHMGGAPAALEAYRSAPTPNVIVLESAGDRNALVNQLDGLAQFCDAGTKVTFDQVLLVSSGDGAKVTIGKPLVAGAKVTGEIVDQHRGKKLVVFKMEYTRNYVRKNGHRQDLTAVKIAAIEG